MYGTGHIDSANKHHHFVFRVSQGLDRESGHLEYWVNDPRKCGRDDESENDRDYDGDHEHNYGRDHRGPQARFEATSIQQVVFSDDPAFRPGSGRDRQPIVDTVLFTGAGKWNGKAGYSFEVRATDRGEPGRHRDTFALVIRDSSGQIVGNVSGDLDGGNIQSTRLGGERRR
jgi:hypothetical protein